MDYILLKRVLNIVKLQLWHKSKRRICIRSYMICCDKCNKEYMKEFDGYLCLKIFLKKRGYNRSRNDIPKLDCLNFCYNLNKFELNIVNNILSKYYSTNIYYERKEITLKNSSDI